MNKVKMKGNKNKGTSLGETDKMSREPMKTTCKRSSVQGPSRAKGKPELKKVIDPMQNMW